MAQVKRSSLEPAKAASAARAFAGDLYIANGKLEDKDRMQMIFQDPHASLNPRWRVREILLLISP